MIIKKKNRQFLSSLLQVVVILSTPNLLNIPTPPHYLKKREHGSSFTGSELKYKVKLNGQFTLIISPYILDDLLREMLVGH